MSLLCAVLTPVQARADENEFEFTGTISSLPATSGFVGDWTVAGRTVHVTSATTIDRDEGQPAVGARVEVEGALQADGSVNATHIEVEQAASQTANFQFRGLVEQLPTTSGFIGDWVIGGRTVHVTSSTMLQQVQRALAVGVPVKVIGTLRPDGSVDAVKIETERQVLPSLFEFTGTIQTLPTTSDLTGDWMIGGRTVHVTSLTRLDNEGGTFAVGTNVEVKGTVRTDGTIDALKIEVESANATELHGVITSLPNTPGFIGDWTIDGRTVHVTSATRLDQEEGLIAVGAFVEVEGTVRADNSIDATRIEVERSADQQRTPSSFEFHGFIEQLPGTANQLGDWRISGRTVHVTSATRLRPNLSAMTGGAFVEVSGTLRPDGSVDATSIEVERASGTGTTSPFFVFYGTVENLPTASGFTGDWVVSGRTVHVVSTTQILSRHRPLVTGALVRVVGTLRSDGSIDATQIHLERSENTGRRVNFFEFFGTVQGVPSGGNVGDWTVSGLTVHVTSATQFAPRNRTVTVGSRVKIVGTQRPDGSLDAAMIVVQGDISDSDDFVTTHYEDFLNREPDDSGLNFWRNQIDECASRPEAERQQCRELRRINTSAAFFLSIEFQKTGYLVYRLYQVSYGRMPRLSEFLADVRTISEGVIVGQPGWEQLLEANTVAFIEDWVHHPDFVARYDGLTNAQYVDALFRNAGITPTTDERNRLIAGLDAGTLTRAAVLRQVAENAQFSAKEFNRAFVLMQYFGYLRRNPDEGPDHDLSGLNFWLNKLNQFGGNFVNAEMVKAFLNSGEYQGRFSHR